jgi:DNA recombination protein RmuC
MNNIIPIVILVLSAVSLCGVILLLFRKVSIDLRPLQDTIRTVEKSYERIERSVRDEIATSRQEVATSMQQSREELGNTLKGVGDTLHQQLVTLIQANDQKLETVRETVEQRLLVIADESSKKLDQVRLDAVMAGKSLREELSVTMRNFTDTLAGRIDEMSKSQTEKLINFGERLDALTQSNEQKLDTVRDTVSIHLHSIQETNTKQMTQVREEFAASAHSLRAEVAVTLKTVAEAQSHQLEVFGRRLDSVSQTTDQQLTAVRGTIEEQLKLLQHENAIQLTEARQQTTIDFRTLQEQVSSALKTFSESVANRINDLASMEQIQLDHMQERLVKLTEDNEKQLEGLRIVVGEGFKLNLDESSRKLDDMRAESGAWARQTREEMTNSLKGSNDSILRTLTGISDRQKRELETLTIQLAKLTESIEQRLDMLRVAVEKKLKDLQEDNTRQLDQMRATVDEKLQGTLERRLGESFKQVSEQLEQVYKGLGEMQVLATGVGDLKKMLTNVKTRGTWGEVQLGAMLEQVLAPEQYAPNVATTDGGERVEFAIKLPGRGDDDCEVVWLPIDAKFPIEDYHRLIEAQEKGDAQLAEAASRQLENRVKQSARDICEKYLNPPMTTDFAILFLPIEGLFAEVIRRTGLCDYVQREYKVAIAGPTTLWAILNSLQMGFRTLSVQKRSSEVWNLLGAVKTEWSKYGDTLDKVQKKLHEASDSIDKAQTRTRAIGRRLREVQDLPASEAQSLLMTESSNEYPDLEPVVA